jgi:hypothetical protein
MVYCSQCNHVEVNAQVYMLKNIDTNREYLTMPEVAQRSGLTIIYLAQLPRKGTLEGVQPSREWFVHSDSLEKFLATPRKLGPRGPRKSPLASRDTYDDQRNRDQQHTS